MKLPSLRISLPFIFVCWCIAGVQAHGLVILAYPAMWAAVGICFLGLHLMIRAPAVADSATGGAAAGLNSAGQNAVGNTTGTAAAESTQLSEARDDTPSDHQPSTPV